MMKSELREKVAELIRLLKITENSMDMLNGAQGNEVELCLFCHSNRVDSSGIVHDDSCPIVLLRQVLKEKILK